MSVVGGLAGALAVVPFLAAAVGLAVGRLRPKLVGPVAVAGTALAGLLALVLTVAVLTGDTVTATLASVPTGTAPFEVTVRVDGLAAVVAVAVTTVAGLVQLYSVGYLRGDPRYSSYAALVSLFTAAMLLVVVAGDLLLLYVGWEVMGICSYFLVGHHWEQEEARAAAVKAFLTTRIGDVLLLFGIFTLATAAGSFDIAAVSAAALHGTAGTVGLLLVFGGAIGKSAQFPLHVWLPDAMAGPTPVSALIHAATMVAAGVYLLLRLWPLFAADAAVLASVAVVAAVTMVGSALAALAQEDLKRVLAWSTVSQLAVMFAGLAVAAPAAAAFHLLTHAAFKALLFLCAGSVMHSVGTSLLRDMGGLRHPMPVTFATMTVGLGALAGVPPLAGFFSKESVLAAAEEAAVHGDGSVATWSAWLVLIAGLLTVGLTAAYSARLWLRTFLGDRRGAVAPHEPPPVMLGPLVALAGLSVVLGVLATPWLLPRWLERSPVAEGPSLAPSPVTALASLALLGAGVWVVYAAWTRQPTLDPADRLGPARPVLESAFGVDTGYDVALVRPLRALARLVVLTDRDVVDAYVRGAGRGARLLGGALRVTQLGNVQRYLTMLLAGVVLIAVAGAVS